MSLTVAILGDSVMWGQGLTADHQFARRAAEEIAEDGAITVVGGLGDDPGRGSPRSGAKIRDTDDEGDRQRVLLPSGALATAPPGDRSDFARVFRSLFESDAELRAFLSDGPAGEGPAARLFGENPATFPTVHGQVRLVGGPSPAVDLVIVNGGANDIAFEEVLDPTGPTPAAINRAIEKVCGPILRDLLTDVRQQFPSAVVIVPGYFSALSANSDQRELKALFEHLADKPEWQFTFNNGIQSVPVLRDVFEAIGFSKDVKALVRSAIRRSVAAAAYTHYRTRRTIAELPDAVRRPGLFYAHPAFRAEHALFAGGETLVHSGYRFPGHGRISVADEMLISRQRRIPRRGLLGDYHDLVSRTSNLLGMSRPGIPSLPVVAIDDLRRDIVRFVADHPDIPSQLVTFARNTDRPDRDRLTNLLRALQAEVGRIETATIASFVHPNVAGAVRYTDRIVIAHRRHRRYSLRVELGRMFGGAGPLSLRRTFENRGADIPTRVQMLAAVTFVESIAILFKGLPIVPALLGKLTTEATLDFGPGAEVAMLVPAGVVSGQSRNVVLAADMPQDTHLSQFRQFRIKDGPLFEEVVLFLNGFEYLRRRRNEGTTQDDALVFGL